MPQAIEVTEVPKSVANHPGSARASRARFGALAETLLLFVNFARARALPRI